MPHMLNPGTETEAAIVCDPPKKRVTEDRDTGECAVGLSLSLDEGDLL